MRKVEQPDPWLALCEQMGTTEAVYVTGTNDSRGEFKIKERGGRLLALIGSRWCTVVRRADDGKLVEVWNR